MAARLCSTDSFAELLCRIPAEYLEMPGLRPHGAPGPCLFGLDSETWDAASAALLDAKFLSRTHNGVFAMAAIPASRRAGFQESAWRTKISPPSTQPFRSWRSLPVGSPAT